MQLNSKVYDVLKSIALLWLPALGTLYFALSGFWHLPAVESINGTVIVIDAFLGGVLGLSTTTYNNSDAKFDGVLSFEDHPDGGSALHLKSVDVNALQTKNELLFKIDAPVATTSVSVPLPSAPTSEAVTLAP